MVVITQQARLCSEVAARKRRWTEVLLGRSGDPERK